MINAQLLGIVFNWIGTILLTPPARLAMLGKNERSQSHW